VLQTRWCTSSPIYRPWAPQCTTLQMDRWTDRRTDGRTDRRTDKQTTLWC